MLKNAWQIDILAHSHFGQNLLCIQKRVAQQYEWAGRNEVSVGVNSKTGTLIVFQKLPGFSDHSSKKVQCPWLEHYASNFRIFQWNIRPKLILDHIRSPRFLHKDTLRKKCVCKSPTNFDFFLRFSNFCNLKQAHTWKAFIALLTVLCAITV